MIRAGQNVPTDVTPDELDAIADAANVGVHEVEAGVYYAVVVDGGSVRVFRAVERAGAVA